MLQKTAEIINKCKYLTFKDLENVYNDIMRKGKDALNQITSLGSYNRGYNQYIEGECNEQIFKISIESKNKDLNHYIHSRLIDILRKEDVVEKRSGRVKNYLERKAEKYSLEEVDNIINLVKKCNDWNVYDYTDEILDGVRIKSSHLSAVKKGLLDNLYVIKNYIVE